MISMRNVAVAASFMTEGMFEVNNRQPDVDIYQVWDKGGIELHDELCQYAELSEKIVEALYAEDSDTSFPGVYDYEVSEPFGMWFAEYIFEHGTAPQFGVAKAHLLTTACQFFSQSHSPNAADCLKLIERVKERIK